MVVLMLLIVVAAFCGGALVGRLRVRDLEKALQAIREHSSEIGIFRGGRPLPVHCGACDHKRTLAAQALLGA